MKAHRASWIAYRGEIPDNLWVLHRCDNRLCVNPEHLFLGTARDNTQDMIKKGRKAPQRGMRNSRVVLTDQQIAAIRAAPFSRVEVAARFGITPSYVSRLVLGTSRNYSCEERLK